MLLIVGSFKKMTTFATANEKTVYGGSNPPGTSIIPLRLFLRGIFFGHARNEHCLTGSNVKI